MRAYLAFVAALASASAGQEPAPPIWQADSNLVAGLQPASVGAPSRVESVVAQDAPYDAGGVIDLYWTLSLDEGLGSNAIASYEVLRATSPDGPFVSRAVLGPGTDRFRDKGAQEGVPYYYVVRVRARDGSTADSNPAGPVWSRGQWFDSRRIHVMGGLLVILIVLAVTKAMPPGEEWVLPAIRTLGMILRRPSRGPIVYVPGTGGLGDMGTIASVTLLEELVRTTAQSGPPMVVYTCDALVHAFVSDQTPDADIRFLCPDPLVFSLTFTGEVFRRTHDTGVVVGAMGNESFLLAEAFRRVGGAAVGGTLDVADTPFLVSSCELTLIGEEILLAGPALAADGCRAALLVHDRLKAAAWFLVLLGVIAAKLGISWYIRLFGAGVE